jgi:hypothetical protein
MVESKTWCLKFFAEANSRFTSSMLKIMGSFLILGRGGI